MNDTRVRCPGWLGAIVLCVMLAAAGVPHGSAGLVDATRIELGDGAGHRGPCLPKLAPARDAAAVLTKGSVVARATTTLPREVRRSLSIVEGGLPPSRAPTV